jgi:23S rRNA (uracil1939-C5)-methyltransferase
LNDETATAPAVIESWEGRIERLGWGGVGIGRHEDGRIILLRHNLAIFPGELVRAEIEWKARHAEGLISEILEPDPLRIEPACQYAEDCGGCSLQGAPQRGTDLKRQMVVDLLAKQLGKDIDWDWFPAGKATLRNVIQLHYTEGKLGYHRRGTHEIVEIDNCPASRMAISSAISSMRKALRDGWLPALDGRWELACGHPDRTVMVWHESDPSFVHELVDGNWKPSDGLLHYELPEGWLVNHASGFYQVCGSSATAFFSRLFRSWQISGDRLHDLYGGCGLFSRLLSDSFNTFSVVDSSERSIASAVANLRDVQVRSFHRDVEDYASRMKSIPNDVIILDPPRSGLSKRMCDMLNNQGAGSLVLIGCDGAAFCRDVGRLKENWRLENMAVADLFPWTEHCEFVALFSNRSD